MKKKIGIITTLSLFALSGTGSLSSQNVSVEGLGDTPNSNDSLISSIEGAQFWFDATALELTNNDKIATLPNLVTPTLEGVTTSATQTNAANQPTYLEHGTIGNGLPTMKFTTNSFFNFGGNQGFYMNDMTIFAVIKANSAETHQEFLSRLSGSPYDHNWFFNLEGGFNFGWGFNNGSSVSYYQAKPHLNESTPYIIAGRRSEGKATSYVNGWVEGTFSGEVGKDPKTKFFIGDGNGAGSIVGEVGEIIGFNKGLSDDEIDLVQSYLEEKWGIRNDTDAMLKSISIKGEKITGFYPKTRKYSALLQDKVEVSDLSYVKYNSTDSVEVTKEGNTFFIKVTSAKTGKVNVYEYEVSSMNYDYNEIKNLELNEVTINEGFWKDLLDQYQDYTINYIFDMYDFTHSFDNFDRVADGERLWKGNTTAHSGMILIPSGGNRLIGDTHGSYSWGKEPWREGLIYECIAAVGNFITSYGHKADKQDRILELKERVDAYIDRIYAAGLTTTGTDQKGKRIDGYFSTINLLTSNSVMDEASGGSIYNHDLYNFGCLIEAGINYYRGTGDTRLLYLATRFAEFVVDYIYGTEDQKGYMAVPPHAIAEETFLDLYELYKNNPNLVKMMEEKYSFVEGLDPNDRYAKLKIRLDKYLDVCNAWVTRKGHYEDRYGHTSYGVYAQDQCDYTEMAEALGHAVRANLFYSGVSAIGNATENYSYIQTMKRIWDNIIDTQLYVTGGTGASEALGEAYAGSYVLPQDGYCETCASVGMAFFADNMFQIFGDSEYADVLELELYNGILGSLSLDGNAFYYCNPLVASNYERPLWSGATPCCPPMYMKVMALLPSYIYAKTADKVFVNQYISSTADFKLNDKNVQIIQYSDLPNGDMAKFKVTASSNFDLKLRIPDWATSYDVQVDGVSVNAMKGSDGYVTVSRNWSGTSDVTIKFSKEVVRLYQEDVSYNKGQVAIKYGPFVYCAEDIDNENGSTNLLRNTSFVLPNDAKFESFVNNDEFELRVIGDEYINHPTTILAVNVECVSGVGAGDTETLTLIPFYIRGNRGNTVMRVWFDETKSNIPFEGTKTKHEFKNAGDKDVFAYYGASMNAASVTNDTLKFNADSEYKAILKEKIDAHKYAVNVSFKADTASKINSGIYLKASNPSNASDMISAINIQVEKNEGSNSYVINVYSFNSSSGYLGKVAGGTNGVVTDGKIDIRAVVLDGKLYVYDGNNLSYPVITYDIPGSFEGNDVGIRSQFCETQIIYFETEK